MAAIYGQGATHDAIEGRFRRYRKMADELRAEAETRGVNIHNGIPRTPRGPRSRAPASASASVSASKSKSTPSASKKQKHGYEEHAPETPTKPNGSLSNTVSSAADVICLDDSSASPEIETKKEADSLFVKMENVNPEHTAIRSPSLPVLSRATPSPAKPKSLIVGSVTPLKRSVESIEDAENSPTPQVKAERQEVTNLFMFGIRDEFAMSDPFVNEDYHEGAA